jgi:hypothetical protein
MVDREVDEAEPTPEALRRFGELTCRGERPGPLFSKERLDPLFQRQLVE